jgi:plastocyanin
MKARLPSLLPLLLAATVACGQGQPPGTPFVAETGADGMQRATITLDSYSYAPARVVVTAGQPVELTLVSAASVVAHDFVVDDPASGLALRQDVGAGKTVKLVFTPPNRGTFAFYCSKKPPFLKSHRARGMEGVLEVR